SWRSPATRTWPTARSRSGTGTVRSATACRWTRRWRTWSRWSAPASTKGPARRPQWTRPPTGRIGAVTGSSGGQPPHVGIADELERLWTPHRMAYIVGEDRSADGYDQPVGCPFCRAPELGDEDSL